jgi:hypothetical protein
MAKDKQAKQVTMKEHIDQKRKSKTYVKPSPPKKEATQFIELGGVNFNEELDQKYRAYNEAIDQFDDLYIKSKPRVDVLVRAFVQPLEKDEDGFIRPNTVPIKKPTQNGMAIAGFAENPFPFTQKAIVVNVPEEITDIKRGDIIYMKHNPVVAVEGQGKNALIHVQNAYVHPDEIFKYEGSVPTDPEDKNFGYLIIEPYNVKFILE